MAAGALARRAASIALVFVTFAIGHTGRLTVMRHRQLGPVGRSGCRKASASLPRARNQHGQSALSCLLKKDRGLFCRRPRHGIHRSAHSTNAGGISLRTIMTRRIRSSRSSVTVPRRASSIVG
jgi:hypothetical protein